MESNSFYGSIRGAENIAKWCKDFGAVNNQPEIVRAGEIIDILMDRVQIDAGLVAEYSNDADKLFEQLKKEKEIFNGTVEELKAAGFDGDKTKLMVGLAHKNKDLHAMNSVLRSNNEELGEMLRLQQEEIKNLKEQLNPTHC